jgi:hypothetical protein
MIAQRVERRFGLGVVLCALAYLMVQVIYISTLPLVKDEFQGAIQVYRASQGIPYVDYWPYKTVLGYLIQVPGLIIPEDIWSRILGIKYEMALINTAALVLAAIMLTRHFSKRSVLIGLLLWICMSTFLERSSALRVDMLTAWAGFFSLLFLLRERPLVAGLLCGIGFLISQKGLYFALSGGAAMAFTWAFAERTKDTANRVGLFVAATLLPIALYVLFFTSLAPSVDDVLGRIFFRHRRQVFADYFPDARAYWWQTLGRNPLFYGLALWGLLRLTWRGHTGARSTHFTPILSIYTLVLTGLCIWHKQSWPYFFVFLIPTAVLSITCLFDSAPWAGFSSSRLRLALALFLGIGAVAYPLTRIPTVLKRDNGAQKNAVRIADHVLDADDVYFAGTEMVFDRVQPKEFRWIDRVVMAKLHWGDVPARTRRFMSAGIKLYISSDRSDKLPAPMRAYLQRDFDHLHGNVFIYCPLITPNRPQAKFVFPGNYLLKGRDGEGPIHVDWVQKKSGDEITLQPGWHHFKATQPIRVCLNPPGWKAVADPRHQERVPIFDSPYRY